jgi:hypothetical protein
VTGGTKICDRDTPPPAGCTQSKPSRRDEEEVVNTPLGTLPVPLEGPGSNKHNEETPLLPPGFEPKLSYFANTLHSKWKTTVTEQGSISGNNLEWVYGVSAEVAWMMDSMMNEHIFPALNSLQHDIEHKQKRRQELQEENRKLVAKISTLEDQPSKPMASSLMTEFNTFREQIEKVDIRQQFRRIDQELNRARADIKTC